MLRLIRSFPAIITLLVLCTPANARPLVVAYVPNWIDLDSFADKIDYAKITHINIAFENPTNPEGDLSFGRKNEKLITTARAHDVKILVSIGGGAAAENTSLRNRYFDLLGPAKRMRFVAELTEYVMAHGFDGLDVDIEGPSINQDYGAFIAELGGELAAKGKVLTAAVSKGYGGDRVPHSVFEHFDFVNIMAYDGTGPWNPRSAGQPSSMEFAQRNVAYWLDRGLPKAKAVLGVPFYGYGFGAAFRTRDYPYYELVASFPGAEKSDQVGETIWYNGIPTITAKSQYVIDQGLAGVMIWSLDYDVNDDRSLLNAIHETLARRSASTDK